MCAIYVLALAYPVHLLMVSEFSDFYIRYASDADRISAGLFPQSTYNPPGYPVLLSAAFAFTGDHFTSGKWLSLFAAGLTGLMVLHLHRRFFGLAPAVLAVAIVYSSWTFVRYSMSAMTDIPFLCACVGAMLAIVSERPGGFRSAILSGLACGAVYLLRYNGVFLLVPGLAVLAARDRAEPSRLKLAAAYLGSFLLTITPWCWLNYVNHGSPFYSTNYEDVARALGLNAPGRAFHSLGDVIVSDPSRFVRNYLRNAASILFSTFGGGLALLPVGPLAALGVCLSLTRHRRRRVFPVLAAAVSFLCVMSLTHWERRYHLFTLVCYAGFAAFAVFEVGRRIERFTGRIGGSAAVTGLTLSILVPSANHTSDTVRSTLQRQPVELLPAASYLDRIAPPGATVMAARATFPYLSHRRWLEVPNASSVDALVTVLRERPPDYVVYDRWARFMTAFFMLTKPNGTVPWLTPIYRDPAGSIVIYAVQLDRTVEDSLAGR